MNIISRCAKFSFCGEDSNFRVDRKYKAGTTFAELKVKQNILRVTERFWLRCSSRYASGSFLVEK
jgi:hypothetical protein